MLLSTFNSTRDFPRRCLTGRTEQPIRIEIDRRALVRRSSKRVSMAAEPIEVRHVDRKPISPIRHGLTEIVKDRIERWERKTASSLTALQCSRSTSQRPAQNPKPCPPCLLLSVPAAMERGLGLTEMTRSGNLVRHATRTKSEHSPRKTSSLYQDDRGRLYERFHGMPRDGPEILVYLRNEAPRGRARGNLHG